MCCSSHLLRRCRCSLLQCSWSEPPRRELPAQQQVPALVLVLRVEAVRFREVAGSQVLAQVATMRRELRRTHTYRNNHPRRSIHRNRTGCIPS